MEQKTTYEEMAKRNKLLEQIILGHEEVEERYSNIIQMMKDPNSGSSMQLNNTLYETPNGIYLNGHYVSNVTNIQIKECIELGNTIVSLECIVSDLIRIGSH